MKYTISQLAYQVLDYLEVNAQGIDNAVFGRTIAHHFNLSTLTIRKAIKEIREETDIVIGADTSIGYYIPLVDELEKANQYRQNKALSELKGNAINDKCFILKAYRVLNDAVKTLDEKAQARLFEDIQLSWIASVDLEQKELNLLDYIKERQENSDDFDEANINDWNNALKNNLNLDCDVEFLIPEGAEYVVTNEESYGSPNGDMSGNHEGYIKYKEQYVHFIMRWTN